MGSKYTESQKRASMKYLAEKTDEVRIRVPKGKKAEYQRQAQKYGLSLTAYITKLVEDDIANTDK